MQLLLHRINIDDVDIAAQLDPQQAVHVIRACGVLYVMAMNGLAKIMAGRQSACQELADADPSCLPMDLIKTSVVDFVSLVGDRKDRPRSAFGDEFVKEIFRQHKDLVRVTAQEAPLLLQLSRSMATRHVFSKSWDTCGYCFRQLLLFLEEIATMMPTTSRVEGDFSSMVYRRNYYCSEMTDFALEGVMYSKKLFDLSESRGEA